MTIPWGQIGLLAAEALLVSGLLLFLFRRRGRIGIAPLYLAVGCLQPLQVLLASALYIEIWPGISVSPGSSVMFPATLLAVLLVYIRDDASEARKLIYGVLTANLVVSGLLFISGLQITGPAASAGFNLSQELFVHNVRVMLVGTLVLFLDALLIIIIYERLSRLMSRSLFVHLFTSFALVLAFDTVAFSLGAFLGESAMAGLLISGLVGKSLMAVVYSAVLASYLTLAGPLGRETLDETAELQVRRRLDPFTRLSFRQKYEAAREQSLRDPLTGLYNRGFFDEILPIALERSRRSGSRVTVLMMDIEGFKAINDTYGHPAGDETLRRFARLLSSSARAEDVLCRYGGDEFAAVIRQDAGKEAGAALIERLRDAMCTENETGRGDLAVPGITIGMATFPGDGETAEELVGAADERLYSQRRAERSGESPSNPDGDGPKETANRAF